MSQSESPTDNPGESSELAAELNRIQSLNDSDAIEALDKLTTSFPNSADVLVRLGILQHRCGQTSAASIKLKKALEMDSTSVEALEALGDICLETAKYKLASQYYRKLCQCRYSHYESRMKLADALFRCNKAEEATEAYRLATRMRGATIDAFRGYASGLALMKKFDEALAVYQVAVSKFPGSDFTAELAELQAQLDAIRARRSDEALSTLGLIARCRKLCDPHEPMEPDAFRDWALRLPWYANCGNALPISPPCLKWFNPYTEHETEIGFAESDYGELSLEPCGIDSVKSARQSELQVILREAASERGLDLTVQAEQLQKVLFPIVEKSVEKVVKRITEESDLEEEESDELEGRFDLAKRDALATTAIILSMLQLGVPVPLDFAIVWFWFAQGHWCFEYELERELPEAESHYSDYIRELTKDWEASFWKDIVYVVL
ncbi:MAG: hypothetical protein K2W95_02140 [Candidatus Obscuribacterales bacterium]|nr:hypothetical protein [Candidatus Obscuribacterales bacterium]